jgi:hypothetical protein
MLSIIEQVVHLSTIGLTVVVIIAQIIFDVCCKD